MSTYLNISDKIKLESSPAPLLLNFYGGAAAAYSLRQLDYNYTGPSVTVRRDSDQTTKDIGFVNGELDTASLEAFTTETVVHFDEDFTTDTGWSISDSNITISGGKMNFVGTSGINYKDYGSIPFTKVRVTFEITDYTSGTITFRNFGGGGVIGTYRSEVGTYVEEVTLLGGNQNWGLSPNNFTGSIDNYKVEVIESNAFVTTWYDQSGNGNDATQTTSSAQPKIVSSGSTILDNGKAAVDFDGIDDYLLSNNNIGISGSSSRAATSVVNRHTTDSQDYIWGWGEGLQGTNCSLTSEYYLRYSGGVIKDYSTTGSTNNQELLFLDGYGTDIDSHDLYVNGVLGTPSTASNGTFTLNTDNTQVAIGAQNSSLNLVFDGIAQEFIFWGNQQSTNRSGIETNINDFYSIY